MFNKDIKQRFVDYYSKLNVIHPYRLLAIFASSELFEAALNKDLCNFTKNELKEFYIYKNAKSLNSLQVTNSLIRSYINWCIEQGLSIDNQNHADEVLITDLRSYLNKDVFKNKYITHDELLQYQAELDNPMDKFILQALFEGIKGKTYCELNELSLSDIDRDNNIVHLCTGRSLNISDRLIDLALESAETYQYYPPFGEKVMTLFGNDIIKNTKRGVSDSIERKKERLAARFRLLQKMFDNNYLTAIRVHDAGIIYNMKLTMEKYDMNFDMLLDSDQFKEIRERYCITMPKFQVKDKFKMYL